MVTFVPTDVQAVLKVAQESARRLEHSWIGPEHLLFAMCAGDDRVAFALANAGLSPRPVWDGLRELIGVGPWAVDRDALAALGINIDDILAAVPSLRRTAPRVSRRRRRARHLALNVVAAQCLSAAADSMRLTPGSSARAALAHAIVAADSRTVTLLLERTGVETARLRAALSSVG